MEDLETTKLALLALVESCQLFCFCKTNQDNSFEILITDSDFETVTQGLKSLCMSRLAVIVVAARNDVSTIKCDEPGSCPLLKTAKTT